MPDVQLLDVSEAILAEVRRVCSTLPQARERTVTSGFTFLVRQKTFAFLLAVEDDDGRCSDVMTFRADEMERHALVAQGHPFFAVGATSDRVGMLLNADTDWVEVGELLTESYRLVAPEKLLVLLDESG